MRSAVIDDGGAPGWVTADSSGGAREVAEQGPVKWSDTDAKALHRSKSTRRRRPKGNESAADDDVRSLR